MPPEEHLPLHVEGGRGKEPVHVERLDGDLFQVLFSPGLVEASPRVMSFALWTQPQELSKSFDAAETSASNSS